MNSSTQTLNTDLCIDLLKRWSKYAENDWYPIPGREDLGCYGTGYNAWAVQTNQKYLAGMAALGVHGDEQALSRALAALRFSLASHKSGELHCTDGSNWGHTWISSLGIERMMYAVHLLEPHMSDDDRTAVRRVLASEADWLLELHERYGLKGIFGEVWEVNGKNHPESNLWNGALLWRTASMYPDHPRAEQWREGAHVFLINALSVPADAQNESMVAGRKVKERFIGANFFPNFALDHRGFMNLGYMVICASNAAMLHFDMRLAGFPAPESLYHHIDGLWSTIRRMIFPNGRLVRIGGNTRIRNTYTQEYLLPSLLFASDRLNDSHAVGLANTFLEMIREEMNQNNDGSFYGNRLQRLRALNPYYATRLESDRACVLGMGAAYAPLLREPNGQVAVQEDFESSVAGGWAEPEHGSVMHRCSTRLASFVWRAFGLTQGLCQPPENGHLAEWDRNLGGLVEAAHHVYDNRHNEHLLYPHLILKPPPPHRRLIGCRVAEFPGGFLTCGSVMEGIDVELADGWYGTDSAVHQQVFAALPDNHTVVSLEHCLSAPRRTFFQEVQGMHLNILNDLYNGFRRTVLAESGTRVLEKPVEEDELLDLDSSWANIDGCLGVVGLYGASTLSLLRLKREHRRRGPEFTTMNVEELAWGIRRGCFSADPETVLLDVGWMVISAADGEATRRLAETNRSAALQTDVPGLRAVAVSATDGKSYRIYANFSTETVEIDMRGSHVLADCSSGPSGSSGRIRLEPCQAVILGE